MYSVKALILVILLSLAGSISAENAGGGIGMDYLDIFQKEFPDPVVEMTPSPIAGIHTGVAYDRSWLAEDPFTPPYWILTEDGYRDILSHESVAQALQRIRFVPNSESEALHAARLYTSNSELLLMDAATGYETPESVPAELRALIRPPSVQRTGSGYEVVLWVFGQDNEHSWFEKGPPPQWLTRYRYEIGDSYYRVIPEVLWSKP